MGFWAQLPFQFLVLSLSFQCSKVKIQENSIEMTVLKQQKDNKKDPKGHGRMTKNECSCDFNTATLLKATENNPLYY